MCVDQEAERGRVSNPPGEKLPEGDHDPEVRPSRLEFVRDIGIADELGSQERQSFPLREFAHGRGHTAASASPRAVGLTHDDD